MKFKSIIFALLCAISTSSFSQRAEFEYKYKQGDPRNEYFSKGYYDFPNFVKRYEQFRESHESVLNRIGPDTLWLKEIDLAKKEGGHIVEAVINPSEEIELCMTPADAEKVTHLKLTGRAYKWGEYTAYNMVRFVSKLKKLKVLNLRDLDCELLFVPIFEITVPKLILPANCKAYGISLTSSFHMKEVVYNEDLEAIASIVDFGPMVKEYMKSDGLHTLEMKNVVVPSKVEYIAGIYFHEKCEMLTLPNSLKEIGGMEFYNPARLNRNFKNLKKIRINRAEPPFIKKYDNKISYEQAKNIILSVPKGCKEAYSKDVVWRLFNIIEEGEPPVEELLENTTNKTDAASLLLGRWYFQKEVLVDNKGHFKDRKPYNGAWWEFNSDEFIEGYYKNGVEETDKLNYEFNENKISLILPNGLLNYDVEKLTDKELVISITNKRNGYDYKLTFYFTK